jgi:hypothetical protein
MDCCSRNVCLGHLCRGKAPAQSSGPRRPMSWCPMHVAMKLVIRGGVSQHLNIIFQTYKQIKNIIYKHI